MGISPTSYKKGQGGRPIGSKNKATLLAEKLQTRDIKELKEEVLHVWKELIHDKDKKMRAFAAKEISKYLFPTKRDVKKHENINYNYDLTGILKELREKKEPKELEEAKIMLPTAVIQPVEQSVTHDK